MTQLDQIWEHDWPSGADKPLGGLNADPSELHEKFRLQFKRGVDDLDAYSQVAIRLPSGRVIQLLRYDVYPEAGTIAFVDSLDNVVDARKELLKTLRLGEQAFRWLQ